MQLDYEAMDVRVVHVKNVVAVGLDLGVKLANPNSPNDSWTTVMRCKPKAVKVQHANKGKTVT